MKIGIQLSYDKDLFPKNKLYELYSSYVKFTPVAFTKKYKSVPWKESKHIKQLRTYNDNDSIFVSDRNWNSFSSGLARSKSFRNISIEQDASLFLPANQDITDHIQEGFVTGYIYHETYTYVQSQISETTLFREDIEQEILDSIKQTPYKLDMFNKKRFDILYNPGRQVLTATTWLMPAWKMWLGEPFFRLCPKEKILQFPHATRIEELPNGIVFVQLFDNIADPYTVENKFRQWKWQEWIDFDQILASEE
ncbi:MAG: hypothetical protein P0Y53_18080 [Candidatus Pseudobacter hemicellulosilyticus]|uniref:Uncharacterized protein n=1 Tax=Candidatus Pseudobacter hemicellulosilyticus TaxID=3121375 RepID=A0AAJ6BG45_9BACT|nr:MAG: hypothetical protein P0Y53_18080 [Pseudobacter sp.]